MNTVTRAAVLRSFGPPHEGLTVAEVALPSPGPGEVQVRMLAAPINPADLNIISGKYGELPELPSVIGNEGAGRIASVGEGVLGFAAGDLVAVLRRGTWAEAVTASADDVVKVPPATDPLQAAMLAVNPPTALLMLRSFVPLAPGDWIAQNAANSAVGRSIIAIARARGLRTLNVVRRDGLDGELTALGADRVVTEECDLRRETRNLCEGALPKLGLNAVGGASALNIANALAPGSTLVTYGAMGLQPLKIPNGLLIFSDLRFTGFWLTNWKKRTSAAEREEVFAELGALLGTGALRLPVGSVFPLEALHAALDTAQAAGRTGKILLCPGTGPA